MVMMDFTDKRGMTGNRPRMIPAYDVVESNILCELMLKWNVLGVCKTHAGHSDSQNWMNGTMARTLYLGHGSQ